ncbi:hypothetical protein BB561_001039 [Smittium simulii]|uniref:Uncharacterized protein n=1 Tax=Smittium simulii TaxID=133385 RepID=A0A2T9YWE2_9FUNG|nr:hypothetical protein BB561_001039 [Smittium simulii]
MKKKIVTFTIIAAVVVAAQKTTTGMNESISTSSNDSNGNLPTSTHSSTSLASTTNSLKIIKNPTDPIIITEISENYSNFVKVANDAIVDLAKKNKGAADAAKKALGGKDTVPTDYDEKVLKALLTASPEILTYESVWDIVNKNEPSVIFRSRNVVFINAKYSTKSHTKASKSPSNTLVFFNIYGTSLLGLGLLIYWS